MSRFECILSLPRVSHRCRWAWYVSILWVAKPDVDCLKISYITHSPDLLKGRARVGVETQTLKTLICFVLCWFPVQDKHWSLFCLLHKGSHRKQQHGITRPSTVPVCVFYLLLVCVIVCVHGMSQEFYLLVCVIVCVCAWGCMCHRVHVSIKGQLCAACSLLPFLWILSPGFQGKSLHCLSHLSSPCLSLN